MYLQLVEKRKEIIKKEGRVLDALDRYDEVAGWKIGTKPSESETDASRRWARQSKNTTSKGRLAADNNHARTVSIFGHNHAPSLTFFALTQATAIFQLGWRFIMA